ncbi:MAG: M56 family metallopeptidase [Bacteroidota bacterium]
MNDLLIYLFKASCCMGALYLVYSLLLRRETFFRINRCYLLLVPLVSLAIPLLPSLQIIPSSPGIFRTMLEPVMIKSGQTIDKDGFAIPVPDLLTIIFLSGFLFFALRFIVRLVHLFSLIDRGWVNRSGGARIAVLPGKNAPFSFFNMIFIPESMVDQDSIKTILVHETVHIRQAHTFDLVLTECLSTLMWFNPFIWLIRRELRTIHEYLADQGVIRKGIPTAEYQQLLFTESTGLTFSTIASSFNFSTLKKRMIMMTKKPSNRWAAGKLAITVPVILALGLLFSPVKYIAAQSGDKQKQAKTTETIPKQASDKSAQAGSSKDNVTPDVMPKYPGGDDARMKFMLENIKYPEKAKRDTIQGKVFIQFVVEPDGTLTNFKIMRGIGGGCDEEALRVVKLMPKWIPAQKNGKSVKTEFVFPIKFALN